MLEWFSRKQLKFQPANRQQLKQTFKLRNVESSSGEAWCLHVQHLGDEEKARNFSRVYVRVEKTFLSTDGLCCCFWLLPEMEIGWNREPGENRNKKMYMRNKFPLKMCVSVDSGRGGMSGLENNIRENSFEVLKNAGERKLKNAFPPQRDRRKDSAKATKLERDFWLFY